MNVKPYYFCYIGLLHFLNIDLKTRKVKEIDRIHAQKSRIFVENLWQVAEVFKRKECHNLSKTSVL